MTRYVVNDDDGSVVAIVEAASVLDACTVARKEGLSASTATVAVLTPSVRQLLGEAFGGEPGGVGEDVYVIDGELWLAYALGDERGWVSLNDLNECSRTVEALRVQAAAKSEQDAEYWFRQSIEDNCRWEDDCEAGVWSPLVLFDDGIWRSTCYHGGERVANDDISGWWTVYVPGVGRSHRLYASAEEAQRDCGSW